MGEITEMIMEGVLCDLCGGLMEDLIIEGQKELKPGPGYPRTCAACQEDEE